jgi:hypothetical protein
LQQFFGIGHALSQIQQRIDDAFQLSAFLAKLLGAFGVVPYFRIFEFS